MGYAVYRIGNSRWGGYGVPAYCEHPECEKEIDRGMAYACGGEPFSEHGCDQYFCSDHRSFACVLSATQEDHDCEENEDECEVHEVCEACATYYDGHERPNFPYKQEHPRWLYHILHDYTWEEWRKENPERVEEFKKELGDYKPPEGDDDTQEHEPAD